MPNKKTRKKQLPAVDFDLDPSTAPSAPTPSPFASISKSSTKKSKKRKSKTTDDTPKAFTRLLGIASGAKLYSGLDDGHVVGSKKRKRDVPVVTQASKTEAELAKIRVGLKIQPNESLSAFSRRVDAAIPVKFPRGQGKMKLDDPKSADGATATAATKKKGPKTKAQRTAEREAAELENEDLSEEEDGEVDHWADPAFHGRKTKGPRGKCDSPDPWEELKQKRGAAPKFGEVAEAPPALKKPRRVFRVYGGAGVDVDSVPRAVGSLAKREELASERRGLIEGYRKMMEERRAAGGTN